MTVQNVMTKSQNGLEKKKKKIVCSNPGGFGEEVYSSGSRVGFLIRIRVCAGPALL